MWAILSYLIWLLAILFILYNKKPFDYILLFKFFKSYI